VSLIIVDRLLEKGLVTQDDVDRANQLRKQDPLLKIEEILLQQGLVSEKDLVQSTAEIFGFEHVLQIDPAQLDTAVLGELSIEFLKDQSLLPLGRNNGHYKVAIADPFNIHPLDDLRRMMKQRDLTPVIASRRIIDLAINSFLEGRKDVAQKVIDDMGRQVDVMDFAEIQETEDLLDVAKKAPVIKLVNSILFEAIKARASDIHIEPFEKSLKVRYRVDGILYDAPSPPKRVQAALSSRIKILANLNIAESRLPQDGRTSITLGDRKLDIRVSILPTAFGERIVLRLLEKQTVLSLTGIGFAEEMFKEFRKLILSPHGILLVTGPTGSGKSTTLYSALTTLTTTEKNIITVEDPIENQIQNVSQMQVKPQIGLSFADGLRSILRQDPDIIMVGEIRDRETAEISVQASLTGHLVFSTLHTNDSAGSVTRMIDMGIEPYLIASSIIGALAQRLVRVICPSCRTRMAVTAELEAEYQLKVPYIYYGKGCESCRDTGYHGRKGIFELFVIDEIIRELVTQRKPTGVIRSQAIAAGMISLRGDGLRKVEAGLTTIEEVARVTQS